MQGQPKAHGTAVSGNLALVKRQRGRQWYARYRLPDGRRVNKRLGPAWEGGGRPSVGYFTRRTAQAALDAILTDARRGELPTATRTGVTFADAVAEWLRYVEHDRQRRPSTVRDYRNVAAHDFLPAFGSKALEQVTTEAIDRYRARLVADGRLSSRTINKQLVLLHGIFKRAQRAYGLRANPVATVECQPQRRSGDFNVLTPSEVEALTRAASEQDGALFTVAAFTGLRVGELLALRWADVDFTKRLVHVRRSYTRGTIGMRSRARCAASR